MFSQRGEVCNHVIFEENQVLHGHTQESYRTGKFNYFLSNNATVESQMLHQRLT